MKKFVFAIFVFIFLFNTFDFVLAQDTGVEINFFYSESCPHCAHEEKFLDELQEKYPEIEINRFSVSNRNNIELLKEFYKEYEVPVKYYGMVPITFTDERYFLGFNEEIGESIKDCILECKKDKISEESVTVIDLEGDINLPVIGKINLKKYSLPALAVILGFLDGFNICSLGALVLILGLVLAIKSRKKTLLFGGLFILTTTVVYGILVVIWYQVFSFLIPYIRIMEILIGLLAIGGGVYFLRQFIRFKKYGPMCEVGLGKGIMSKFSLKFQESFKKSGNILLLLGSILLFAGIITVVEFPCSAVVPVIFAGVLSQAQLSTFYYLLYIALFVLLYMLDEIIIFLVAFFTMKVWLASSKAITWITLVEAIILFLLGFYYLFGSSALL